MKKFGDAPNLIVAMVILYLLFTFFGEENRRSAPRVLQIATVSPAIYDEIERITLEKYRTRVRFATISKELGEMVICDPTYVAVCLAIVEAYGFPGISEDDKKRILSLAGRNSEQAMEDLKKVIYANVTEQMRRHGRDPKTENRRAWDENNPCTSLLFIKFPSAQKSGTLPKLMRELLGGRKNGEPWIDRGQWPIVRKPHII